MENHTHRPSLTKAAHIFELTIYFIVALVLVFFILPWLTNFKGFMYREDGNKALDFPGTFSAESAPADVFCLGSSHVYTQIIPMKIWEEQGIPVYDLRSSLQPISVSYHYLVEALKTQKPQLVLLDLHMLSSKYSEVSEGNNINQNVSAGLSWSENKIDLIQNAIPEGQRAHLYFDLYAFHNRWKALEPQDFEYFKGRLLGSVERDYMKGGLFMFAWKQSDSRFTTDAPYTEIDDDTYAYNYQYIRRIAELCHDNGIQLVLMMTLYSRTNDSIYRLERVQNDLRADGFDLPILNLNDYREQMGIDDEVDMWDEVHTTYEGAMKVSQFMGDYLRDTFQLQDRHADNNWRTWNRDLEKYIDLRDRRLEQFR